MKYTAVVPVRLSKEQEEAVKSFASVKGTTVSDVIRVAIEAFMAAGGGEVSEKAGWCQFRDQVDMTVCWEQAEFTVTRLAGGRSEARACGRHLADVMMTGDMDPPWVVRPLGAWNE